MMHVGLETMTSDGQNASPAYYMHQAAKDRAMRVLFEAENEELKQQNCALECKHREVLDICGMAIRRAEEAASAAERAKDSLLVIEARQGLPWWRRLFNRKSDGPTWESREAGSLEYG